MNKATQNNVEIWKKPLIIIAAARSGTKMLREVLASIPEVTDFSYDMNYVWKYNNYHIPHDELTSAHMTPEIRQFIRNKFKKKCAKNKNAKVLLEKSVPNSLRVDFVKNVFPQCKIIHLYRDGRDVSSDALFCWRDSALSGRIQSKKDLLVKLTEFPYAMALPYLANYISLYFKKAFSKNKQLKSWGPRFKGIDDIVLTNPLISVCALQWAKSVETTLSHLSRYKQGIDYIDVRYEDLVTEPATELLRIARFSGIENVEPIIESAQKNITNSYIGFWERHITQEDLSKIYPIIEPFMSVLGYPLNPVD